MAPGVSTTIEQTESLKFINSANVANAIENGVVNENVLSLIPYVKGTRTIYNVKRFFYLCIKRMFDIICALIGCLTILPIAGIIKACNLLTGDKKSIFYKQERVGKNGKLIYIYKFRSMVHNADEVLKELLKDPKYKKEWDTNQKFEDDPRITKIGKFLRKTSIDELPQLITVDCCWC